jgi:hypothetical protein
MDCPVCADDGTLQLRWKLRQLHTRMQNVEELLQAARAGQPLGPLIGAQAIVEQELAIQYVKTVALDVASMLRIYINTKEPLDEAAAFACLRKLEQVAEPPQQYRKLSVEKQYCRDNGDTRTIEGTLRTLEQERTIRYQMNRRQIQCADPRIEWDEDFTEGDGWHYVDFSFGLVDADEDVEETDAD